MRICIYIGTPLIEPNTVLVQIGAVEPIDYRTVNHPCSNGAVEPVNYRIQYHPCSNGAVVPLNDRA